MLDTLKPLGFVALALNIIFIPSEISKTKQREIAGYGRMYTDQIPGYLIGHFARFDGVEKTELSGEDMFERISKVK